MDLVQRWENPVLVKDLRTRMRGGKAFWLMAVYTVVLLIAFGIWYAAEALNAGNDPAQWNEAGKHWFSAMFVVQAVLIVVLTPALTSGAFTLEHEQRTFELMVLTTLSPTVMVLGRLLSAVAFAALLLACSIPFASLCFMLGSVSPAEVLVSYVSLLLTALLFGSLGLACSTVTRRTAVATLLSYSLLFACWGITAALAISTWVGLAMGGGLTYSVFAAFEPIQAALFGAESGRFFGGLVPLWTVGFPIYLIAIWLLTTLAINNFPHHAGGKTGWLRAQTLLLFVALTLCVAGAFWSPIVAGFMPLAPAGAASVSTSSAREFAGVVLGSVLGFILLLTPIFCTKALYRLPREGLWQVLLSALNPVHLWRGRLRSAPLYMLLWLLLSVPLLAVSYRLGGSSITSVGWLTLLKLYAVMLSVAAFYILLSVFFSLLFRPHRAVGIVLLYGLTAAMAIIPPVLYTVATDVLMQSQPRPMLVPWWAEGVYLSPVVPIGAIVTNRPPTYFLHTRLPTDAWWLACVVIYGFFALALALCNVGLFQWWQWQERRHIPDSQSQNA